MYKSIIHLDVRMLEFIAGSADKTNSLFILLLTKIRINIILQHSRQILVLCYLHEDYMILIDKLCK